MRWISYHVKPLQTKDLCATVKRMADLNDRTRRRIRDAMAAHKLSQQEVADMLKWTQSRVAQKLTGRTPITLDELEALAFAVGIQPTEAVRDRGLEFCAEMTPTELRTLEILRELPPQIREHFQGMLSFHSKSRIESRGITKSKVNIPKGRGR
jgi:transcriptional regulator with XRE-family HTH domain